MEQNNALNEAQISNRKLIEDSFEVARWLKGKNKGTKQLYLHAMRTYCEYTGQSPKQLIDVAEEDRKKSIRARGEPELKLSSFFEWLTSDYAQMKKGRAKKASGKKGLSRNLSYVFTSSIKGFYRQNGFPLAIKIPRAIPKKENFKLILRVPEIKRLLDATTNLRDKAIILTLFQSGMSINELCNLTYGDIANGLQTNEEPLNLHLIRKKEQVEYDTFVGTDAIEAIKSYLAQRQRNKEILNHNSPLFILQFTTDRKSSKYKKIKSSLVEAFLKAAALKSGVLNKEQSDAADISPCRPHALRTAFISILKMAGANNTLVEYFCGHSINPTEKAYLRLTTDELRKTYKQYEKYLSLSGIVDNQKLEALENKSKTFEEEAKKNKSFIEILYQNSSYKDAQINNMTALLTQVQESLAKINDEQDFHRLEDVARFVAAKTPTREEMTNFLRRRQINENIFRRPELNCIFFSSQTNTWIYAQEDDTANLLMA